MEQDTGLNVATAYNREQAEAYDELRFTKPSGVRIHQAELAVLREAMTHVPTGSRVLEVGCGTGRLLMEIMNAGYILEGTDASENMLRMLEQKLAAQGASIPLRVAEAAKLAAEDNSYDMVYSIRMLNQTESPEYALCAIRDMIRVVKPGGYVLIEFVNRWRLRLGMNRRATTRLSAAEVIDTARDAGAGPVYCRGAFFLGMQAINASPKPLLGLVCGTDRFLAKLMPRLCARCYMLVRKEPRQ